MDEVSSLCSSNSNGHMILDKIRFPKPPPSLGRRKQRQVAAYQPQDFRSGDEFFEHCPINAEEQYVNQNHNQNYAIEVKDSYDSFSNVSSNIHIKNLFSTVQSQSLMQHTSNLFTNDSSAPCYNVGMDSATEFPRNGKICSFSSHSEISQNKDKYTPISEVQNLSRFPTLASRIWINGHGSEAENIGFGWSDQVLGKVYTRA